MSYVTTYVGFSSGLGEEEAYWEEVNQLIAEHELMRGRECIPKFLPMAIQGARLPQVDVYSVVFNYGPNPKEMAEILKTAHTSKHPAHVDWPDIVQLCWNNEHDEGVGLITVVGKEKVDEFDLYEV